MCQLSRFTHCFATALHSRRTASPSDVHARNNASTNLFRFRNNVNFVCTSLRFIKPSSACRVETTANKLANHLIIGTYATKTFAECTFLGGAWCGKWHGVGQSKEGQRQTLPSNFGWLQRMRITSDGMRMCNTVYPGKMATFLRAPVNVLIECGKMYANTLLSVCAAQQQITASMRIERITHCKHMHPHPRAHTHIDIYPGALKFRS